MLMDLCTLEPIAIHTNCVCRGASSAEHVPNKTATEINSIYLVICWASIC